MNFEALQAWWDAIDAWDRAGPWLIAAGILAVGFILGRMIAAIASRLAWRAGSPHLSSIAKRLLFYVVLLLAFFAALGHLGINPAALLTTAGLLTVALGFAAQTSVANVISGIFLLVDRPFSIEDTVKVDTTLGVVLAIDLLSTKIRTFDNLVVRFPNEAMLKATITNYSLNNVRRIEQTVSVSYDTDLTQALSVIGAALTRHGLIFDEPEPFILVDQLAESGVVIIVRAWCLREDFVIARSDLTVSLKESLQEAGIEIPFPQRVIHTQPAAEESEPESAQERRSATP